jgi:hypothetical protein
LASQFNDTLNLLAEILLGFRPALNSVNGLRLCESDGLAFVEKRTVTFVFFPLTPEHIDECFLLVEGGLVLEDGVVLVLF